MRKSSATPSYEMVLLVADRKDQASQVMARAFRADPVYTHLFPDEDERLRSLEEIWDALIGYSLVYGRVYTTSTVQGAACWLSPGNTEITLWRMLRTGLALQRAVMRFRPAARRQMLPAVTYMDKNHKRLATEPHWYLWALGVEPDCQGQGIGGKLLQPILVQSDEEATSCYLETQTERNVAFYQKRGFEVVHKGELPGLGLPVWSMLREPR